MLAALGIYGVTAYWSPGTREDRSLRGQKPRA
jgi:hypothetical protein